MVAIVQNDTNDGSAITRFTTGLTSLSNDDFTGVPLES